jgi:hypothetical protein
MPSLSLRLEHDTIRVGDHVEITFYRTLRLPDDGKVYPLPPGLGTFPIVRVEDYADRVPAAWREAGGFIIAMYQREALWIRFRGAVWRPNAVKVAAGGINAVTGGPLTESLNGLTGSESNSGESDGMEPDGSERDGATSGSDQDYLVIPRQPWLDGFKTAAGQIRQFVAMPLGMGYTAEGQLTGKETEGGLQFRVYEPRPGRFPDVPPRESWGSHGSGGPLLYGVAEPMLAMGVVACAGPESAAMGLGAGGRMDQDIYPDPYGVDTWDPNAVTRIHVHIANSMQWREITGQAPPTTPVTAKEYARHGLPWFDLYDEGLGDLEPQDALKHLKSITEVDQQKGFAPQQDNETVPITDQQVVTLPLPPLAPTATWPKSPAAE